MRERWPAENRLWAAVGFYFEFLSLHQFVLENSSREDKHECPFARSSIQLTLILCDILRIGEPRKSTLSLLNTNLYCHCKTTNLKNISLLPPFSPPAASETGSNYHPIFFSQDRLMDELFCVCIQLLNKTWKEMRATQEDFDKVRRPGGQAERGVCFPARYRTVIHSSPILFFLFFVFLSL